jgi:TPR repeat protein
MHSFSFSHSFSSPHVAPAMFAPSLGVPSTTGRAITYFAQRPKPMRREVTPRRWRARSYVLGEMPAHSALASTSAAARSPAIALPTPPVAAPDHNEVAGLLARGRAYLSEGDVALARLYLRRAAERYDPQAALALGGTYDPAELRRIGIANFQAQADMAKAREWYRRAADLGSAAAALRLQQLP